MLGTRAVHVHYQLDDAPTMLWTLTAFTTRISTAPMSVISPRATQGQGYTYDRPSYASQTSELADGGDPDRCHGCHLDVNTF